MDKEGYIYDQFPLGFWFKDFQVKTDNNSKEQQQLQVAFQNQVLIVILCTLPEGIAIYIHGEVYNLIFFLFSFFFFSTSTAHCSQESSSLSLPCCLCSLFFSQHVHIYSFPVQSSLGFFDFQFSFFFHFVLLGKQSTRC